MAYQKRYRATIPVPRNDAVDDQLTVWLVRESFDRAAAADALVLADFRDLGELAIEDIPPKAEKQMGRPASDFVWRSFEGIGRRTEAATDA